MSATTVTARRVEGHVALVTGGGAGLGRAISLMLASEGAAIVIADIDADRAASVAAEVNDQGGDALAVAVDTTDEVQVDRAVQQGIERFGKIDILVNNAGIVTTSPLLDLSVQDWDRVVAVHLRSTFLCTRAIGREMADRSWGRIVNIISRAAFRGRVGNGPYAAAKGGILALSRVTAQELAEFGVTVNNVAPGTAVTPMFKEFFPMPEQEIEEAVRSGVVTEPKRLLHPDEIAAAVLYLCGPLSDQVTGTTLHVNGGSHMP